MSEKRYKFGIIKGSRQAHITDCHTCKSATIDVYDDNIKYFVDLLNEQQATINELQAKLKEKEEDEQLYADEIVKLNKEAKEVLDFKSLGGDY